MMAFLDKLKFWEKKEPELDLGGEEDFSKDEVFGIGSETAPGQFPGMERQQQTPEFRQPAESYSQSSYAPSYAQPQPMAQPQQQAYHPKDLEVISAKLDAIRATLDSINQRLSNLERMNRGKEVW